MVNERGYGQLRALLRSWGMVDLMPHLQSEAINVKELKLMKQHHLDDMLRKFPMGTRIRFEHHLAHWRRSQNVPLEGARGQSLTHCQGCRCANTHSQAACTTDSGTTGPSGPPSGPPNHDAVEPEVEIVEMPTTSQVCVKIDDSDEEAPGSDQPVTVLRILQADSIGRQFLSDLLSKEEKLNEPERQQLIQMICSYYEYNQLHLTLQHSHQLEREILRIFPWEKLEYYRTQRRGRIYVRFINIKSRESRRRRRNTIVNLSPQSPPPPRQRRRDPRLRPLNRRHRDRDLSE